MTILYIIYYIGKCFLASFFQLTHIQSILPSTSVFLPRRFTRTEDWYRNSGTKRPTNIYELVMYFAWRGMKARKTTAKLRWCQHEIQPVRRSAQSTWNGRECRDINSIFDFGCQCHVSIVRYQLTYLLGCQQNQQRYTALMLNSHEYFWYEDFSKRSAACHPNVMYGA